MMLIAFNRPVMRISNRMTYPNSKTKMRRLKKARKARTVRMNLKRVKKTRSKRRRRPKKSLSQKNPRKRSRK